MIANDEKDKNIFQYPRRKSKSVDVHRQRDENDKRKSKWSYFYDLYPQNSPRYQNSFNITIFRDLRFYRLI